MRRISYWLLSTLSAIVLVVGFDASRHGTGIASTATAPFTSSTTSGGTTNGTSNASKGTSGGQSSGKSSKTSNSAKPSASRTVTGSVAQTQWGPVQVQLVVTDGSITKVTVLQYPNGNSRDAEINSYALPILIQETTQHQSASIDMVSGATVTSTGYLESLQSALDQAGL